MEYTIVIYFIGPPKGLDIIYVHLSPVHIFYYSSPMHAGFTDNDHYLLLVTDFIFPAVGYFSEAGDSGIPTAPV